MISIHILIWIATINVNISKSSRGRGFFDNILSYAENVVDDISDYVFDFIDNDPENLGKETLS